jgi:hypothetical protein
MADMTPEQEAVEDAKARLKQLDFKVEQAQEAVDKAPTDPGARNALDTMVSIRDVAKEALAKAESKAEQK